MSNRITWVGLDVHKDSITAADTRLYRSGHLTSIRVPTEDQETVRRLVRLRYSYQEQAKDTKRRINSICFYQGWVFRETKTLWTLKHRTWLNQLQQEVTGPLATVLRTELQHLEYLETQRNSLDVEIESYARRPPYRQAVQALSCLRGVKTLTAMILLTEIGDIHRFRSPRAFMAWVGLVPEERSSGSRERRGKITKAGNSHVRRILIEAGWQHRYRSRADVKLGNRRKGMPPEIVAIAVKAQHRLTNRFRRLERRKDNRVVVAAVARELCGFIWAIMRAVPQPSQDTASTSRSGRRSDRRILDTGVRAGHARSRDLGLRQLRTNSRNCGNQPANISLMIVDQ